MDQIHIDKIATELQIENRKVKATVVLLEQGDSIPFIARYRKEKTGSLDEVHITSIRDRLKQLEDLDKRRDAIYKSLSNQGKLTDELKEKVLGAETMAVLEDIYLPYKPKRRTRGMVAKEKGLEPLAKIIFEQGLIDPLQEALAFVSTEKGVDIPDNALEGARDIIAEWINEDQEIRQLTRSLFIEEGEYSSKVILGKEDEGAKYKDYFKWHEKAKTAPSHRILAMRRGEKEEILNLRLEPSEERAISIIEGLCIKSDNLASELVKLAAHDCFKRLLSHSMETEARVKSKKDADQHAIHIFENNLRQLLLAAPLGQKSVMAIDPGFRTGCKIVCLNPQGKLLHTDKIFPLFSDEKKDIAALTIKDLCERFKIEAIAIGNGTGGRETEAFIRELSLSQEIQVVVVNESGASIYSASKAARDEFPDYDVTVRGAVSIGRRLMDPLAELVKIDPKSIGVGQYQHDVDQKALKESLADVVMSCVNAVGVDLNTASCQLLSYVSGLGPQLAKNIVAYRDANGPFPDRGPLMDVTRLGAKAFQQAAGFLRINNGDNPLDSSAVHPESYPIVARMADDLGCSIQELIKNNELQKQIRVQDYVSEEVGLPTLNDIISELAKPGRDPRERFENVVFAKDVQELEDLAPGMKLPGVITNITAFGAFVDIGVHHDGLVHISELSDHFVKDPHKLVKVNEKVLVRVLKVDPERKRISLSLKSDEGKDRNKVSVKEKKETSKQKKQGAKKQSRGGFNNPFIDAFK